MDTMNAGGSLDLESMGSTPTNAIGMMSGSSRSASGGASAFDNVSKAVKSGAKRMAVDAASTALTGVPLGSMLGM